MPICPKCAAASPEASRFCPSCATPLAGAAVGETATSLNTAPSSESSLPSDSPGGRFLPGAMVAGRYRIVGLLGRGGMGEVYRADDTKLGHAVALKFLPQGLERDENRLRRFLNEARTARQVTHANVCRVFDIDEVDGQHFLSMEYIDGEDLASLLRRIGRLPEEKAIQIARQLCAGVAAAHEAGILHRDLKPANVMIDGKGRVRITDFGLAGAGAVEGAEATAGTPAYMAPEQLDGKEATVRSDLYSLGLVLYELFTGKRAFAGDTLAELKRLRLESAPTSMTGMVENLDPAIERIVLGCLESDPQARPGSALAIASGLPGADPLAAALAAGETPSPELVAAAGESGTTPLRVAIAYLVAAIVGGALAIVLAGPMAPHRLMPLELSPAVLENRAREILRGFGYDEPPIDSAYAFEWNRGYLDLVFDLPEDMRLAAFARESPSALRFWYRESPVVMVPWQGSIMGLYRETITPDDPPPVEPGMRKVVLGPRGLLISLRVVPPAFVRSERGEGYDWSGVFEKAGLDAGAFRETDPIRTSPVASDRRHAWIGTYPDADDLPLRIEAASLGGAPVWFEQIGPWDAADDDEFDARRERKQVEMKTGTAGMSLLLLTAMVVMVSLAFRNLRAGRADRAGAMRLAWFMFVMNLVFWLFHASHVGHVGPDGLQLISALAWATARAGLGALLFLGLEPYLRRSWPDRMISWSRLLAGRWRDPLVGRDVLVALAAVSIGSCLLVGYFRFFPSMLLPPDALAGRALTSPRYLVAEFAGSVNGAVGNGLVVLSLLVLLRGLLGRPWLAASVWSVVGGALVFAQSGQPLASGLPVVAVVIGLSLIIIHRFGLLAYLVTLFWFSAVGTSPLTLDFAIWYSTGTMMITTAYMGAAVWAFVTATRRGQVLP